MVWDGVKDKRCAEKEVLRFVQIFALDGNRKAKDACSLCTRAHVSGTWPAFLACLKCQQIRDVCHLCSGKLARFEMLSPEVPLTSLLMFQFGQLHRAVCSMHSSKIRCHLLSSGRFQYI